MKILIVHNDYGKYSGEEAVVDKMASMLESHGNQVVFYRLSSKEALNRKTGMIHGFFSGIYSRSGVAGMREALRRYQPDIVHVHNLFPFISPAALFQCRKAGVPVVMTVHNYRLICPTGLFMRNGKACEICLAMGNEWGCIRYNCEHSYPKSIGYALRSTYARWSGAFKKNVDQFCCITQFQRNKLIEAGFDARKITVIPNSIDFPKHCECIPGNYVGYIGRLSFEKGYDMLLEIARRNPTIPFRIAGANRYGYTKDLPSNITLSGYLEGSELSNFIRNASFIVIPSRCYEGFPMSILEAASHRKPVVAPNHGGFPEIIGIGDSKIGYLFRPYDSADLEDKIKALWKAPEEVERLGRRAYEITAKLYDAEIIYERWMKLYRETINKKLEISIQSNAI